MSTDGIGGVARKAGVVGGATLASRVLGLFRDIVLANAFLTFSTDAFFMAFMIPNLFRRLVGEGTLTGAFVPIFTGALRRSHEGARHFLSATWTLAALVGLAIALLGILGAEPLVRLFAPGFAYEPGKLELCVGLLRLCFPYILFLSLVAVAMGALNATGHFFAPAIAPVLLNLSLIGAALLAGQLFEVPLLSLEKPAYALALAATLAGLLQVLLQLPVLRARGLGPRWVLAPRQPELRRLLVVMGPAVLGASVYQLNLLVVRVLSSFLGDGAVSYLYYADRLMELPLGVFIFAISTAALPTLSRLVKEGDAPGTRRAFSGTLALALALALPSTAGLIMLREPIFAVLFSWNPSVFGDQAIRGCAQALLFYSLGLVPITVSRICVQLCLSNENTGTPARGALVSLGVNVLAALALMGPQAQGSMPDWVVAVQGRLVIADLGFAGLALATSVAAGANALYLAAACRRRYGAFQPRSDLLRALRLLLATAGMVAALWVLGQLAPVPRVASIVGLLLLGLHVAAGVVAFLAGLVLVRSPELGSLRAVLGSR